MFTFALAFFAGHRYFSLHFQPLSAFRGEESIQNKNYWPQLPHVSGVESQIDRFACFAAFFSSFPKENAFQSLEKNLWTINRNTEFPDFSLTLTKSKILPDFLKNSLTFPWPWKIFVFPWLIPERGNPGLRLFLSYFWSYLYGENVDKGKLIWYREAGMKMLSWGGGGGGRRLKFCVYVWEALKNRWVQGGGWKIWL